MKLYLWINSALYLLLSFWCLIKPAATARYLGYVFLNNSGRAEYLTVYTGLELALAVFFAVSGNYPNMRFGGLFLCVLIYGAAMLIRPISAIAYGNIDRATYVMGALEYTLGVWGIVLLLNELRK